MARQQRQGDPLEQMLRQAAKQQDDVVRYTVNFNGVENVIIEKRRRIEWRADPQSNGVLVPYLVSDVVYSLDDNGMPFGAMNKVGACRFGHPTVTKSLVTCRLCRSSICRRHSVTVGSRAYCRSGSCLVIGGTLWFFWGIYRLIRFCVRSVLGLPNDDNSASQS